jgi:hypothetical protein
MLGDYFEIVRLPDGSFLITTIREPEADNFIEFTFEQGEEVSSSSSSSSESSYSSESLESSYSSYSSFSSESSYSSESSSSFEKGCVVYGHDSDVIEDFVRDFQGNWSGDAEIDDSGDDERLLFNGVGHEEISESRYIGIGQVSIEINAYKSGKDSVDIYYRTASTKAACDVAGWTLYSGSFSSSGWVGVRLVSI